MPVKSAEKSMPRHSSEILNPYCTFGQGLPMKVQSSSSIVPSLFRSTYFRSPMPVSRWW